MACVMNVMPKVVNLCDVHHASHWRVQVSPMHGTCSHSQWRTAQSIHDTKDIQREDNATMTRLME
jgi:hypothetical protein